MKNRVVSPKKLVVATLAFDETENPVSFNPPRNKNNNAITIKNIFSEIIKNPSLFFI